MPDITHYVPSYQKQVEKAAKAEAKWREINLEMLRSMRPNARIWSLRLGRECTYLLGEGNTAPAEGFVPIKAQPADTKIEYSRELGIMRLLRYGETLNELKVA